VASFHGMRDRCLQKGLLRMGLARGLSAKGSPLGLSDRTAIPGGENPASSSLGLRLHQAIEAIDATG
jgi:hypothetical protein